MKDKAIAHIPESYQKEFEAFNCDPDKIIILSGTETFETGQDYTVADEVGSL